MTAMTTAEALKRYRDELNGAGFDPEIVERLVVQAAQELVANEGLGVRDEVTA